MDARTDGGAGTGAAGAAAGTVRSRASFMGVLLLAGLSAGLARVMASLHAVALGASPVELGIVAASQSLGLFLMSVPSAALVRRHGPRRVFVVASVAGACACAAVPLVPMPSFLAVATVTVGLCMPLRFVATHVVALSRLEREGPRWAGWYRGSNVSGMFLLGPAVAVPAATTLGLGWAWALVSACFLLAAAVAPLTLRGRGNHAVKRRGAEWRRDREALGLMSNEFAASGAFTYFSFFVVPIATERCGLRPAAAMGLVTAQATSYVVTLFAGGALAGRCPRIRLVLGAYGATACALVALGLAAGGASVWAGSVLLGAGLGLLQTDNVVRAARLGSRVGPDVAAGLQSLSGSAGGLATGLVGGVVAQRLGAQGPFIALAPLFAVLAWRELGRAGITRRASEAVAGAGSASSRSRASASAPGACEG